MARTPRDYKTEYARRIELGRKRGYSKARARGHRSSQADIPTTRTPEFQDRLDRAYAAFRETRNLTRSAKAAKVSPERFRTYLRANKLVRKRGKAWSLLADNRIRQSDMLTQRGWSVVVFRGFDAASAIGSHLAAVGQFKDTGNAGPLAPFIGQGITDISGRLHLFETRPNYILRLIKAGRSSFEQVYRVFSR